MNFNRKQFIRGISALTIVIVLAYEMSNSVYAAVSGMTAEMVTEDTQIQELSSANESKVNQAYDATKRAFRTKNADDMTYAKKIIESLSPTNRIRLFVRMARNYYYANYLDFNNKYFNAYAYLRANPDVAAKARISNDPILYALEHYLNTGIYEGRSSQTSFDPILAILIDPDCILAVMETGELTPDIINQEFIKHTGITTTEGYTILWTAPVDGVGVYTDVTLARSLYIYKEQPSEGTIGSEGQTLTELLGNDDEQSKPEEESTKPEEESTKPEEEVTKPEEESTKPEEEVTKPEEESTKPEEEDIPETSPELDNEPFINKKASVIKPFELFFDCSNESKQMGTLLGAGPNGTDATVTYYGQTYSDIKDRCLSEQKDYTFMIYMCGSNQENNRRYVRVSKQLMSMLKAGELENINVLLCIGGSPSFQNNYMNGEDSEEDSIKNDGIGIYYLDGSKFTSAYNNLSENGKSVFDKEFVDMTFTPLYELKEALGIINQDTFKKIAQVSSIDMGDPGLLSGFINLATELFPADNYGLSLSNHGGGLEAGVCLSADSDGIKGTAITAEELESALRATSLYSEKKKLGTLFYDACLMSSSEIAYSLKDYYEYMLASEEVTLGETDYGILLRAISDKSKLSDVEDVNKEITQQMLEAYVETSYHKGQGYYLNASTISVFSSEQIDKAVAELNDAALLMQDVLNESGIEQNGIDKKLFEATRKSLLSCADYYDASSKKNMAYKKALDVKNVVDLGEFAGYLIKNITPIIEDIPESGDENISIRNKLIDIKEKLLEVCSNGKPIDGKSYIWKGVSIIDDGNVTKEYKKLRGEDVNTFGISVVIPGTDALGKQYASYFDYEGSPLKEYYNYIEKYYEYIDDSSRKEMITSLASELEEADYTKLLIPVKDDEGGIIQSLSDANDSSYIAFKVADSYEEARLEVPAHSLGSPMQDILETGYSIDISVVHQEKYDIKGEPGSTDDSANGVVGTLKVDMICGEAIIDPNSVSFDNGTVSFSVNNLSIAVTGYKLSGEAKSGTEEHGDTWQYVLASEYEKNNAKKVEILTQLMLIGDNYVSDYLFIKGTAKTETEILNNVQHVFYKTLSDYEYVGTVAVSEDDSTTGAGVTVENEYALDEIKEISAYHYVLVNEGEVDNPKYVRKCLEVDYAGYGISSGYYSVTEDSKPTISVINITQTVDDEQDSINNNGYVLSLRDEKTGTTLGYSDIAKLDKENYDTAKDSGNGLLDVNESGEQGFLSGSGLAVLDEISHDNDTNDGMSEADTSSYESNLTSQGKNIIMDIEQINEDVQITEAVELTEEVAIAVLPEEALVAVPTEENAADGLVEEALVAAPTEENAADGLAEEALVAAPTEENTADGLAEEALLTVSTEKNTTDVSTDQAVVMLEEVIQEEISAEEVVLDNVTDNLDFEDNTTETVQIEDAVVIDNIVEISELAESGNAA